MNKYGFLRENKEDALKVGIDKETGLCRTSLLDYLNIIFPTIDDWVHDKIIPREFTENKLYRNRPDYRSEKLKLIVEFDGIHHYTNPDVILKDKNNTKLYQSFGYKVVRIPYFIQLTNKTVEQLFNVKVKEQLFPDNIPSLTYKNRNTPAYLCPSGIERMRNELKQFPEQYEINKKHLIEENNLELTRVDLLY